MAPAFSGPSYILRFIEYMDVGNTNGWRLDEVVPAAEILDRVASEMPLDALSTELSRRSGPAFQAPHRRRGSRRDLVGHNPFCGDCPRARLSADGRLYTCLFAGELATTCGALCEWNH